MAKSAFKIIIGLFVFFTILPVIAQNPNIAEKLIVATKIAPPFAMKTQSGDWEGISIELWQSVAELRSKNPELRTRKNSEFIKIPYYFQSID